MSLPRIVPPARAPGRIGFVTAFVRNPLEVIPQAAYEEDFVALGRARAWVTSPSMIKAVLLDQRDNFRKLTQIRLLRPLLGKGILTSEGADWKWQRQAAAPMFRPQTLGAFVPTFVRAAEDTLARWRAAPGVRNVDEDMTRATFDVISATLLPSADQAFVDRMQASISALQRHGGWDMLYASLKLPAWFPRPGMLAEFEAMRTLRQAVARLLREQRETQRDADSLLTRLVAARDPESGRAMDDEQLVDNLLTFYLAGHETTAKALTWTLFLLARSGDWSERLAREIREVTAGKPVDASHVERLVLVQQVLKESMVAHPALPVHAVRRRAARVHRHVVRDDGGDRHARDIPAARGLRGSAGRGPGAGRARDADPARRHEAARGDAIASEGMIAVHPATLDRWPDVEAAGLREVARPKPTRALVRLELRGK